MADLITRAIRNARMTTRSAIQGEFGNSNPPPPTGWGTSVYSGSDDATIGISTYWACLRALAGDVGLLPFQAYTGSKFGARQVAPVQPQLVVQPFGPDTSVDTGMAQIVMSLAMHGNAYLYVSSSDGLGWPTSVFVLNPAQVQVRINQLTGRKEFKVRGFADPTLNNVWVGGDKVRHIVNVMSYPGSPVGIDPLTANRQAFENSYSIESYGNQYFKTASNPSGLISLEGNTTPTTAQQVADAWESRNAGIGNAFRVPVLGGGAKFQTIMPNPEAAQMLLSKEWSREEICMLMDVPVSRLGVFQDTGGGKGIDAIDKNYITKSLGNYLAKIENCFNLMIPGGESTWTFFDTAGLVASSPLDLAQINMSYRTQGVLSPNEVRASIGLPPVADPVMDSYDLALNSNATSPGINSPAPSGTGNNEDVST